MRSELSARSLPGALLLAAGLASSALVGLPLLYVVLRALGAPEDAWEQFWQAGAFGVVVRSVGLAAAVAASAVAISVPYAWIVVRTDVPASRLLAAAGALPLVIPSYVGALAVLGAFGPRGMLQRMLEPLGVERLPQVDGFVGSWLALTLFTYPYALLLVSAAMARLDLSLERAARTLGFGPWRAFFRATLPQLRPSMAAGGLLCALYTLSDFGVVSLMRYDTFTRSIFVRYRSLFDREGAAMLSLVLCVVTIAVLLAERYARGRRELAARRVRSGAERTPVQLGRARWLALGYCLGVVLFALIVPSLVLVAWILERPGPQLELALQMGPQIAGSLLASAAAAVLAVIAALPVALIAARMRGRVGGFVESWAYAGFALPGVVIALGLVFFATRYASFLYQTLSLLVLAYVIRFLPQAVGGLRTAIERVNPQLEAAARGMGSSRIDTFRRITLPLAGPGALAGAALVFVTAMKELPATLILRPNEFDTLATEIWNQSSVGQYGRAAVPALILIVVSAVPLYLLVVRRPAQADATGEA